MTPLPIPPWAEVFIRSGILSKEIEVSANEMGWNYVKNVEMILGLLNSTGMKIELQEPAILNVNRAVVFVCHISKDECVNIEFDHDLLTTDRLEREWVIRKIEEKLSVKK